MYLIDTYFVSYVYNVSYRYILFLCLLVNLLVDYNVINSYLTVN